MTNPSWHQFIRSIKVRPGKIPLPFELLINDLKNKGFVIGVDQRLRLHALLKGLNMGEGHPPDDLKTLLCPIFAVNAGQQEIFYRTFNRHFPLWQTAARPLKGKTADAVKVQEDTAAVLPQKPVSRWCVVLAAILWMVMIALFVNGYIGEPKVIKPEATSTSARPIVKVDSEVQRKDDIIVTVPIAKASTLTPTFYQQYGRLIKWTSGLMPVIVFALFMMVRSLNQKLAAERNQGGKPPFRWPLKVDPVRPGFLKDRRFFKIASRLRQRISGNIELLDMDATIAATIAHSGFPHIQYKLATRPPEYLVLTDKAGGGDHFAAFAGNLCAALVDEGLFVRQAGFTGDPRICFDPSDGRRFKLAILANRYPNHRLILIGNGEQFIDPDTAGLAAWSAIFQNWPKRAILTPVPARQWSMREIVLARLFTVLPANLDGLSAVKDCFEDSAHRNDLKAWVEADRSPAVPRSPARDIDALKVYMGDTGFDWLCTCAVYPELNWGLTLQLGLLTRTLTEENLMRLVRLPWFRKGSLPETLRLKLMAALVALDTGRLQTVRQYIGVALENDPPD